MKDEKMEKYRQILRDYDTEIREWLVSIYSEHGKQLTLSIGSILKKEVFFLLFDSDKEFRSISYDCYSKLIKKLPFLRDQTEMLFLFIKEYHYISSQRININNFIFLSDELNEWVIHTWEKNKVNLLTFSYNWIYSFANAEDSWPATHRRKSNDPYIEYDYDHKQKSNLFNLDSLYRKMPKKSFTKGKKQEFEILMMYFWLHEIVGDDEGYWQIYLEKVLPGLK